LGETSTRKRRDPFLASQSRARQWCSWGTGSPAPERDWDDFKGADLHGKVALFLVNDPIGLELGELPTMA